MADQTSRNSDVCACSQQTAALSYYDAPSLGGFTMRLLWAAFAVALSLAWTLTCALYSAVWLAARQLLTVSAEFSKYRRFPVTIARRLSVLEHPYSPPHGMLSTSKRRPKAPCPVGESCRVPQAHGPLSVDCSLRPFHCCYLISGCALPPAVHTPSLPQLGVGQLLPRPFAKTAAVLLVRDTRVPWYLNTASNAEPPMGGSPAFLQTSIPFSLLLRWLSFVTTFNLLSAPVGSHSSQSSIC